MSAKETSAVFSSAEVQRNSPSLGKGQRRNLSSTTKVLSLILAAAQHLDSSCTDCWNRAVRFGRPDLLEVCANSDLPRLRQWKVQAEKVCEPPLERVLSDHRRGRERLYQFCSAKRPRHVWFSSPCRVCGTSQRVSRILDGIEAVAPRVQALGCHVHFAQPLSVSSWRQNSLMSVSGKMMSSRQRLRLGFARLKRKSVEPVLASFDHISRRSTSAESSNLRQETQTRQTLSSLQ